MNSSSPGVLSYRSGSRVLWRRRECVILKTIGVDKLLLEIRDDGREDVVAVEDVGPVGEIKPSRHLDAFTENDIETAKGRMALLKPILDEPPGRRAELVKVAAKAAKRSVPTIYRWIRNVECNAALTSLASKRKGSQKGQRRLNPAVEAIIEEVLRSDYLHKQRRTVQACIDKIRRLCRDAGLKPPGRDTVYNRANALPADEVMARRHGRKAARDKLGPAAGKFPNSEYPLQTVQIDHTKLDIQLVDEATGVSIGRPWLTAAIDTFSGMVTGVHLSFDAPCVAGVGMCIFQSAVQKRAYLESVDVEGDWPVWGLPSAIHVDNGKDFRSVALADACLEHGVTLEFRPVRRPEYGGHIERLFRTLNSCIHDLPGTTRSNPQDRGAYNSEKEAALTIEELETILVGHIVNDYHLRQRQKDKSSPLDRWERGISGPKGIGLPEPIADERKLYLSLLPQFDRTVQRQGIVIDHIHYFDPKLARWIGSGRSFKVKRDTKNISAIYFWDPEVRDFLEIRTARLDRPDMTLAELRAAIASLKAQNLPVDENWIFAEHAKREEIIANAKNRQKKTLRTNAQKKRQEKELARAPKKKPASDKKHLKVIEGGVQSNGTTAAPPPKRKFKLKKSTGKSTYEDW